MPPIHGASTPSWPNDPLRGTDPAKAGQEQAQWAPGAAKWGWATPAVADLFNSTNADWRRSPHHPPDSQHRTRARATGLPA
eukprot:5468873-Alexandrium_andersonii.AAC.1